MTTVVIVIHLMVVLAMIGLILLQRSEGGALGIGGGQGAFMTGRSAGNVLSHTTAYLALAFFADLARTGADREITSRRPPTSSSGCRARRPPPLAPAPAAGAGGHADQRRGSAEAARRVQAARRRRPHGGAELARRRRDCAGTRAGCRAAHAAGPTSAPRATCARPAAPPPATGARPRAVTRADALGAGRRIGRPILTEI